MDLKRGNKNQELGNKRGQSQFSTLLVYILTLEILEKSNKTSDLHKSTVYNLVSQFPTLVL